MNNQFFNKIISFCLSQKTSVESVQVFRFWDYLIFAVLTGICWTAITHFLSSWSSPNVWKASLLWYGLATLLILRSILLHQMLWFSLLLMRKPKPMTPKKGRKVAVVTTFVPEAEPFSMLEQTLKALVNLDYTHDTWVLDEGDTDEVKTLCHQLGANHFSRKQLPHYHTSNGTFQTRSKHGNYNAWLYERGFDNYEILVNFDPDHVPKKEFLLQVLGYFNIPTIGYVQAAQVYYNQPASFIARGAAEETYEYYSVTQMAYHGLGHPIVIGCHTAQRLTALKEVGGFAAHNADDLLITLKYRANGWDGVYIPKIMAKGITPVDWQGYLKQQLRWSHSVLDIKMRVYPKLVSKLRHIEKIAALLHGLYYLRGLESLFITCLFAFMLATGTTPAFVKYSTFKELALLGFILGAVNLYKQRFFLNVHTEWGIHWRSKILYLAKWPHMLIGFFDALRGQEKPYEITLKIKNRFQRSMLFKPHALIIALITGTWMFSVVTSNELHRSLHIWAGITILMESILIWTETRPHPAPFDKKLLFETQSKDKSV